MSNFRWRNTSEFIGARDAQVSYKILRNTPHEEGGTIAGRGLLLKVQGETVGKEWSGSEAGQSFKYPHKIEKSIDFVRLRCRRAAEFSRKFPIVTKLSQNSFLECRSVGCDDGIGIARIRIRDILISRESFRYDEILSR